MKQAAMEIAPANLDLTEILDRIDASVAEGHISEADQWIESLEPADRLIVLSRLSRLTRRNLFLGLPAEKAADYLHDIPEVQALNLLQGIEPNDAVHILDELPKDERADLVGELPQSAQDSILAEMKSDVAAEVRDLIEYEDEEAGGMMYVEFVAVPASLTLGEVTRKLQDNAADIAGYDVQYIYVVESGSGKLVGVLRLRDLLFSTPSQSVRSLMIVAPIAVKATQTLKNLHQFFADHSFVGVPVVDDEDRLVGVLRRGDVENALAEKYANHYMKSQGIVDEELRAMPLGLRAGRRLSWLSINIVLNIVAASVIAFYQDTLAQVIALAVFLPIISDMSGCGGNQAVAVSMRELSLGLVKPSEVSYVLKKEIGVGLINGFCLGLLIAAVAWLWQGNAWLGLVVGIAMMANTLLAVALGGTLPLVMRLLKLDPALASGPILTTVTDMCGFFLLLSLASLWLDKLI